MLRTLTLFFFFFTSLTFSPVLASESGHKITVEIENFDQTEAYLAGYIGDTPYILDTVAINNGTVVFAADTTLEAGVYLIVLPPDNKLRYVYRKTHFFDNVDFTDASLYRNPMLPKKIDYYLQQLTPATPDSIIVGLDRILNKVKPVEKTFRYYLSQLLNQYAEEAQTKIGMDAVYVHLVDNYYARGMAPWLDKEPLEKIMLESQRRRPTLIGRRAMNIEMRKEEDFD